MSICGGIVVLHMDYVANNNELFGDMPQLRTSARRRITKQLIAATQKKAIT